MKTISIIPESKEHWLRLRHDKINSTECSALFGANEYITEYQLWHEKRQSEPTTLEESTRMRFGTKLQPVIAEMIAEQERWIIKSKPEYIYSDDYNIGSSFDYELVGQDCLLEIKNVDGLIFKNKWTEDEAPPSIEFQVQQQMLLSGLRKAVIGVCIGGNDIRLYHRTYNNDIGQAILLKVNEFWLREEPPEIDYARDASFISSLYNTSESGKVIESTQDIDDIVAAYQSVSDQIKELESRKEMYKAQLLTKIDTAEKVRSPFYTISLGMTKDVPMNYVRKGYRQFKINFKKEKHHE